MIYQLTYCRPNASYPDTAIRQLRVIAHSAATAARAAIVAMLERRVIADCPTDDVRAILDNLWVDCLGDPRPGDPLCHREAMEAMNADKYLIDTRVSR